MRQLKNFLIKREQSQACLSFAKREKSRLLAKTLLTLALLLTAATGAWAESKPIGLNVEYEAGDEITSTTDVYVYYGEQPSTSKQMVVKITSTQPLKIFMIFNKSFELNGDAAVYYMPGGEATGGYAGAIPCVGESTGDATVVHVASGSGTLTDPYVFGSGPSAASAATSGPEVAWDKAKKTGTFTMPAGNVTLEPEYYPQAALTAAPTAINDVPATTDGAIVKAGTVANIGSTETAQGTVMYYVSTTALDDAALLALAADQWTADVPTAKSLAQGQAYIYYYVRGNDSDNDEENFSDGDILAANALTVTIAAEPTYAVTFAEGTEPNEWTASPATDVKKGETVTVTYTGTKKVIGVKAEKKAAEPVADIVWDATNVFNSAHQFEEVSPWNSDHLTYEGITISFSGDDSMFRPYGGMGESMLLCYGDEGESFTFTAPSGKKFCKIEIINNSDVVFDKYGDWTQPEDNKIVWSGTAANAVTLGTVYTVANKLNSIAFYLSE